MQGRPRKTQLFIHAGGTRKQGHDTTRVLPCGPSDGVHLQMSVELIPYEELKWGRFLGRGAEGAVYAAWYLETPVAVKRPESKVEVEMNLHSGIILSLVLTCTSSHISF